LAFFVHLHRGMEPTRNEKMQVTRSEGGAVMSQTFCFIGDPGPARIERLEMLRAAGLKPVRINPCQREIEGLESEPPCALVVGAEVVGRADLITEVRQRASLDGVPLIARVRNPLPEDVERAFADGCDDVLVDGAEAQFEALIASFGQTDAWTAVRAPSGLVLLANENRQERIRLGSVLRRGGFDIRFASDLQEMEHWLTDEQAPRAVVASANLPGGSLHRTLERIVTDHRILAPWVIVNADRDGKEAPSSSGGPKVVHDTGHDPERLTFLMNELLAPAPPEGRRTPRLLYESTVEFTHDGSSDKFYGYTYNVNAGGLFIRTLTPSPRQSQVEVAFRPPCGKGLVTGLAQVVWVSKYRTDGPSTSPAGMGVQFVGWAPADRTGFEGGYRALLEMHGVQHTAADKAAANDAKPTVPPSSPATKTWSTAKSASA
jgi:uncharacterized protein (TIGR02266 family)